MKKIVSFIILAVALGSCSQDIKFNNEAVFQGVKDNLFWRGADAKAVFSVSEGTLTVSAGTLNESVALKVPMPETMVNPKNDNTYVTYALGTSLERVATYSFGDDVAQYHYETAIGVGDGQVVVTEYDGVYISGTFRFNVKNTDPESEAPEVVNMQSGVFYKIPVTQIL